jgi:hypothetical protein
MIDGGRLDLPRRTRGRGEEQQCEAVRPTGNRQADLVVPSAPKPGQALAEALDQFG